MNKAEIDISQGAFRVYEHGGRLMLVISDSGFEVTVRLHPASALVLAGTLIEKAPHVGKPMPQPIIDQCVAVVSGKFGVIAKQLETLSEQAGMRKDG